ncbi:translocation/assembly module TamB domain-containing protein [Rhodobacteraceae bacterium M382]|nr:translocation/assembly module TamB domain-containing protein [Rhodobacteraceae bacterium M382]
MKRILSYSFCAALSLVPMDLAAEEEDEAGGLLVDFLQNTLSSDSRTIKVKGLEGTFSSRATIEQITVADDDGIWLTLHGAELDWNRLALLRGRFSVNSLGADKIEVTRAPNPVDAPADLPSPEAQPFQLPELPVAIELGELRVESVILGKALIGEPALLSLKGALQLADGTLDTSLAVKRLDRQGDRFDLIAGFANETSQLTLDLALIEGAGGLASSLISLPGKPAIALTAKGSGPVADFTSDITLATNGQDRLAGQVALKALPSDDPEAANSIGFSADLGGDVTALMPEEYRPFFGTDTRLDVKGQSDPDGSIRLDRLDLRSAALDLSGQMSMAPGGKLNEARLKAEVRPVPSATTVLLPLSGPPTRITGASLNLIKDKNSGNAFELVAALRDLSRPDTSLNAADITLSGTLDQSAGLALDAQLTAALEGLTFTDQDLNQAVGRDITLDTRLLTDGEAFRLRQMTLRGDGYGAQGDFGLKGLDSGLEFDTALRLVASDLSRFSGVAGQDLGGRITADIDATGAPLSGTYGVELNMLAQDLSANIEQVDPMLSGVSTLKLKAERGADGISIDQFALSATGFEATANGTLSSRDGQLRLDARLFDLAPLVPGVSGPLTLGGDVTREDNTLTGTMRLDGPHTSYAALDGSATFDGQADFNFDATLSELQRFFPEIAGTLTAQGTASRRDGVWQIDTKATGPAGIATEIAGSWDEPTGTADMTAKGQLRLDAANLFIKPNTVKGIAEFDLALKGTPSLDALSGTITTGGTSLALPGAKQSINDLAADVRLAASTATVQVSGVSRNGGNFQVSGPVALQAPFQSGLDIALNDWIVTDNLVFTTTANGRLSYRGALTGRSDLAGTVTFSDTEINLANVSGSVTTAPIPPIRHVNEPASARRTRSRAGLIETASSGSGPDIGLDLLLSAPNKVFARGRGLQAELGGEIKIGGTAANLVPSGQIELIRGTFDFLGRRLDLTKGLVTLQGDLTPYLEFESSTNTDSGTATLDISGPISAPEVTATSDPPRPTEEVLALLLFGTNIEDMSPLALAQLATSVARLSGRGDAGGKKVREELGADTVDVGTDSSGAAQFGAGAYLADGLYTNFTVNTRGETELKLNLDITDNVTAKGSVNSIGESSIGLFFERDY